LATMVYYAAAREAPMVSRTEGLRLLAAFAWTFAPIYAAEKLADFFFISDNTSSFYFMSGWRLILFIVFALTGSVGSGLLIKRAWRAAATQWLAITCCMALFFYLCDSRVCFSAGPDGLEPLRLGLFLGSVSFSGATLGVAARHSQTSPSASLLGGFFGMVAVGFYPVVYLFAGAKLLPPFDPWISAVLLAVATFPVAVATAVTYGSRSGVLLPVVSMGVLFLILFGIAVTYLQDILADFGILALVVAITAAAGTALAKERRTLVAAHRHEFSTLLGVGIMLVLAMMLLTTPDAVNGIVPNSGTPATLGQGTPVYSGAFMEGPAGHAQGAGITVSFSGTNVSSIQPDNYLSAGIGVHAAGCCVDGIDYSYRYDLILFHSGNESMVAAAWEVCDDNAACGGHPWKVLMYTYLLNLGGGSLGENVTLRVSWYQGTHGAGVLWSYSVPGQMNHNFTRFAPPVAENRDFNTGVLVGGTLNSVQKASYFFQFGVMSRYPIGHGGWRVLLTCPSLENVTWSCVKHAMTLNGSQSYWKILWRWGEDYQGTSVTSARPEEIQFGYSTESTPSFQQLW